MLHAKKEYLQATDKRLTNCEYIEFSIDENNRLSFIDKGRLTELQVFDIVNASNLDFGFHDITSRDINFIERINMPSKVKILFKYGVDEQGVIEHDIKRTSAEYYKLKEVLNNDN